MEEQDIDIFPFVTDFKIPDKVQSYYREKGVDVTSVQKQIDGAINAGGKSKADMIIKMSPSFDEILGGSNYGEMVQAAMKRENRASAGFDTYNAAPMAPNPDLNENSKIGNFGRTFFNVAVYEILEGVYDLAVLTKSRAEEIVSGIVGGKGAMNAVKAINDITDEKDMKRAEEFFNSIKLDVDESFSSVTPLNFDENGKVDFSNIRNLDGWLNIAAQTIGFMVPTIFTGGAAAYAKGASLAGKAGKAAGLISRIRQGGALVSTGQKAAITMGTSFLQTFPDYQKEAVANGLNFRDATNMATAMSITTGALEAVGMDAIFKGMGVGKNLSQKGIRMLAAGEAADVFAELGAKAAKGQLSKEILDESASVFVKGLAKKATSPSELKWAGKIAQVIGEKATKPLARSFVKGGIPEGITETLQTVSEDAMKRLYNNFSENAGEDSSYKLPGMEEYAATALFSGFIGAVFGSSLHAMGGSSWAKDNPDNYRQSLFQYVDANVRTEIAKNKNAGFDEVYSKLTAGAVLEDAMSKGRVGPDAISVMRSMAKVSFDANKNMKGVDNVDIDTRWNMFESSRRLSSLASGLREMESAKATISEIDREIASTQDYAEITNLKTRRFAEEAKLGNALPNGTYSNEVELNRRYDELSNVYDQFLKNYSDGKSASAFVKNYNLTSDNNSQLNPNRVVVSESTGSMYSFSDQDGRVSAVNVTPVENPESVSSQLVSGKKYTPVNRYSVDSTPITDYSVFKDAYNSILSDQTRDYNQIDKTSPLDDKAEFLTYISNSANEKLDLENGNDEPASVERFNSLTGGAKKSLDFYNEILEKTGEGSVSADEFVSLFGEKQGSIIQESFGENAEVSSDADVQNTGSDIDTSVNEEVISNEAVSDENSALQEYSEFMKTPEYAEMSSEQRSEKRNEIYDKYRVNENNQTDERPEQIQEADPVESEPIEQSSEGSPSVQSDYASEAERAESIADLDEALSGIEESGIESESQIESINDAIERQLDQDVSAVIEEPGNVTPNEQATQNNATVSTEEDVADFDNFVRVVSSKIPNVVISVEPTVESFQAKATANGAPVTADSFVAKDGSVVFRPDRVSGRKGLHEIGHIWVIDQKLNNPEVYGKGISLVSGSVYEEQVRSNPAYAGYSNEEVLDEALTRAIEHKGAEFVTSAKKRSFREFVSDVVKRIRDIFSFDGMTQDAFENMTLDEFSQRAAADIIDPKSNSFSDNISSETIAENIKNPLLYHSDDRFIYKNGDPSTGYTAGWNAARQRAMSALSAIPLDSSRWTTADKNLIDSVYQSTGYRLSENGVLEAPDGIIFDSIDDMRTEANGDYIRLGNNPSALAVDEIYEKTGFKMRNGVLRFSNPGSIFFNSEGRVSSFKREIPGSGRQGLIRRTIEGGFFAKFNDTTWKGRVFRSVVKSSVGKYIINNESFAKMIDTKDGLITELIHATKRENGRRADHVGTIYKAGIHKLRTLLADSTLQDNSNSVKNVRKVNIKRLADDGNGGLKEETIRVTLATAIELRQLVDTQVAEGVRYGGATMIVDSSFVDENTNQLLPGLSSREVLFKEGSGGISQRTGARVSEIIDENKDEILEGNYTKEILMTPDSYQAMVSEMDRMADVPQAIAMLKEMMNQKVIRDSISNVISISDPNNSPVLSDDYHPIRTYTKKQKGRAIDQKVEDSSILQEREGKPVTIVAGDLFDSLDRHTYEVHNAISHFALVNNLESLANSINEESEGLPEDDLRQYILNEIDNQIETFTDFRKYRKGKLDDSPVNKYVYAGINKFTASIFRFNFGIQFKQIGTYMSIYGQGLIDNDIVRSLDQIRLLTSLSAVNPVMETFTGSGASVIAGTDLGMKTSLGNDTTESRYLKEIFGDGKTGADLEKHWELFGSVIERLTGAHNGYIQGIDFPTMKSLDVIPDVAKGLRRFYNKSDDFFEKHGMAAITKADRGVIITYYEAAKKQAKRDVANGKVAPADELARVAYLTEELMYKTNQIGKVAESTRLQRSGSILSRLIGLYSGQTQRLFNQSLQNVFDYIADPSSETKSKMFWSLSNNFVMNTLYVSLATSVYGILKRFAFGDDLPEEPYEFYAKKVGFDFARNFTGMFVGLPASNILGLILSDIDNEAWTDELVSIPGIDSIEDFVLSMSTIVGSFAEDSEKKAENMREKSYFGLMNSLALMSGYPKILADLTREWFTEDEDDKGSSKRARPKRVKRETNNRDQRRS